jgi:hypothetical protein
MQDALLSLTGQRTVPNLLLQGKSYGGCTDLKKLEFKGEFLGIIAPYVMTAANGRPATKRGFAPISRIALFYFPETVNKHGIRCTAIITLIIATLICIFYNSPSIKWVMLELLLDFTLRCLFGPQLSPIGAMSSMFVGVLEPVWAAGPPKQFAVICGVSMTAMATGFFFAGIPIAGLVVTGMLVFAAGLEALFDVCLGCWMYSKFLLTALSLSLSLTHSVSPFQAKWANLA